MHKSYEELCALAVTGQITGDAMTLLDQHVKECSGCRAFLEDLVPLKAHVTPVVAGSRTHSYTPPERIRERFLQTAARAGLELNPGPAMDCCDLHDISAVQHQPRSSIETLHVRRDRIPRWFGLPHFAVPALAGVLCGVLGFAVARYGVKHAPVQTVVVAPRIQPVAGQDNRTASEIPALAQQNSDANSRIGVLTADLTRAQVDKKELEQQLASVSAKASENEQFEKRFHEVSARLEDANDRAEKLQSDLDAERSRATTAEAISLVQQKATEDANARVTSLVSELDQLRELDSGKSMAGDLISARNLHIVDVYDTDANGQRKRAFGRVFFVEGRSLVFYAYDLLDSHRGNKKVEFQVWGEQAAVNSVSINLGAMRTDDSSQGRWVLTCDNPKVLNRINAVYLTAGSNSRPDSQFRGNKLMYAFLGSPNHP